MHSDTILISCDTITVSRYCQSPFLYFVPRHLHDTPSYFKEYHDTTVVSQKHGIISVQKTVMLLLHHDISLKKC